MLIDLIRHSITLQMEIVSMVAEEVQQRAETYVQTHSDEAYEAFLNQVIGNIEKSVDFVAAPVETLMQVLNSLNPATQATPLSGKVNWNEALNELNQRIQDLKKNLHS